MEGLLLDNDFAEEEDKPYVRLYIKRGEETIAALDPNFETYLYVVADHLDRVLKLLGKVDVHGLRPKSIELVKKTFLGKKVDAIKVAFNRPGDMPDLRHAIRELPGVKEMYEFDIPPARRYLIDRRLTPMSGIRIEGKTIEQDGMKIMILDKPPVPVKVPEQNLKILSFDIEVYNPAGSPRPDKDPIIMVSLADNRGLKRVITWKDFETGHDFVEVVKDEKELLERFVGMVRKCDPDIMMGYNTDLFDFPYIRERARRLKVKLKLGRDGSEVSARKRRFATASRVRGRLHIDVYTMVHFLATIGHIRLIHYNLEEVYKYMLGKGKPDFEFTEFVDAWKQGGERARDLLEYSLSDAIATLEVGLELLPLFFELTHIIRQSPFDVSRMTPGQLVEWLLISEAHNAGELVPARPVGEEFEERLDETYVGAYVMEPAKGLHEDLVVFDYRSLYPSIIVTHNIDPSTLNCDCCKPSQVVTVPELGYKFCTNRRGLIPSTLEKIIQERVRLKTEMKKHRPGSREYCQLDAQQWALKITANSFYGMLGYPRARWYFKQCAESVTSFGRHYIKNTINMARDFGFDVVYSDTDSLFCKLNSKGRDAAGLFLKQVNDSLPGIIELELEGFYPRGVFITKKRYAIIDDEDRIVVKGLEFVRRDWAAIARKTQEAVLKAVLRDGSPKEAAEFVRKTTKDIVGGRVSLEDLIIYTQLSMAIENYRAIGPHVHAAKKLRAKGAEIEPGMIIAYIEAKGSGSISERAVPVEDFKGMDYDADYYVENQVLPAVMRIMEVLGYKDEDLRYEKAKQVKLAEFVGDSKN